MEMDSVEANHNHWIEDTSSHHLLSSSSPDMDDIYRDPELTPRVGDQYQVKIPSLMPEFDHLKLKQSATNAEAIVDCSTIRLPVPVMWVNDVFDLSKYTESGCINNTTKLVASENNNEIRTNHKRSRADQYAVDISDHNATVPEDSMPKLEFLDDGSDNGKGLGLSKCQENPMYSNHMDLDSSLPQYKKSNLKQKCESTDYFPVPGSLGGSWSDIEQESFLLGLYIFGKDLVQVKKFVESKGMGDILSFYYGQFYRSERHRRWSECQKMKRKCVHGHRIFTGWRQQELLSRLLPRVSEECSSTLLEVSRTFGEGKVTLEEYVSILKDSVGLNALVEAIAIGKGKQDLTGNVMEPTKMNQVSSTRPDIPVGKACSSLTSTDIIKFLTGDFRLSKARSSDLFWEAVWPRLLARGWHSEQPKNHGYVGSKHSLVFLVPGIKKFSRRKLAKGNHYFDSISDVLNKVASDPKLLELEAEAVNGIIRVKEENGLDVDAKSDQTGPSDLQQPSYLRPKVPHCNSKVMKFTVVDTSLGSGEPYKIRELRSFPIDGAHSSSPAGVSSKSDSYSSEEQVNETKSADALLLNDQEESCPTIIDDNKLGNIMNCMPTTGVPSDLSSYLSTPVDRSGSGVMVMDSHNDGKRMKCQFRRRKKSGRPDYLSPTPKQQRLNDRNHIESELHTSNFSLGPQLKEEPTLKQQRLNACNHTESEHHTSNVSVGPRLKEEPVRQTFSLEVSDVMVAEGGPLQQKVPAGSSGKCSPDEGIECVLSENCFDASTTCEMVSSHEEPQPQAFLDLNIPHAPPDLGMGEPFNAEESDSIDDSKVASFPSETTNQQPLGSLAMDDSNVMDGAHPSVTNARRQSTRNRPLTIRVLESLECGFFTTRRRGRGATKALSRRNTTPRSSRQHSHDNGGVSENPTTNSGIVAADSIDSKLEGVDEECSSYMSMLDKPQIQSERKEDRDLLGVPLNDLSAAN
ncbi:hypothetical protein AAC387_Pa09g0382 [Persea americana]